MNVLRGEGLGRPDQTETESRVGKAQRGAERDCFPGVATKALEPVVALVRDREDAHCSAPPRLSERRCDQRGDSATLVEAEAAAELDRAIAPAQEQAQVSGTAPLRR